MNLPANTSQLVFLKDKVMSFSSNYPSGRELVDYPKAPQIPPVLAKRSLFEEMPELATLFAELRNQLTTL